MEILDHWLAGASRVISPNCDERPEGTEISLLVIHCISLPPGQFGGEAVNQFFTNQLDPAAHSYFREIYRLKVSAHVFIRRSSDIIQYVPFHKRAWHAGKSCFRGTTCCNDFSVGIELEGTERTEYADEQYAQLASLIKTLIKHYPDLSIDRITGHSDIAPGRKSDPGDYFDWERLYSILKTGTASPDSSQVS